MQKQMIGHFAPKQGQRIDQCIEKEYQALCASWADQPEALVKTTYKNIFPVVAAFWALLTEKMEWTLLPTASAGC